MARKKPRHAQKGNAFYPMGRQAWRVGVQNWWPEVQGHRLVKAVSRVPDTEVWTTPSLKFRTSVHREFGHNTKGQTPADIWLLASEAAYITYPSLSEEISKWRPVPYYRETYIVSKGFCIISLE